jgi:hypothetical protein
LGILRLSRRYGPERLEAAARRALIIGARSYRSIESILAHRLETAPLPGHTTQIIAPRHHEHLRGAAYYQ